VSEIEPVSEIDFFDPFPLDEIFCFLVLCLIFLQLEILESKQSSPTQENRRQCWVFRKAQGMPLNPSAAKLRKGVHKWNFRCSVESLLYCCVHIGNSSARNICFEISVLVLCSVLYIKQSIISM